MKRNILYSTLNSILFSIIGIGFALTLIVSCGTKKKNITYKYEEEFKTYLQNEFKSNELLKKKYILILYANSCSKCSGKLLDQILATKTNDEIGVVFIGIPTDRIQKKVTSRFESIIDSSMAIHHYEVNIGNPCFFEVEGETICNQTTLNEQQWIRLKNLYGL